MDLQLTDRVALVCGGSAGLGFAVAEALLAEGARVALNGRDPARLAAAVARLRGADGKVVPSRIEGYPADVSRGEECMALVERVHAAMGGPDVVLCNSGGPPAGSFDSHGAATWQAALDTSLLSAVHLARAAVIHMRVAGWGRILCLTSVAARQPSAGLILSTTARAGVLGFAKALSDEVAAEGITVNVLCPGYFGTDRLHELAEARGRAAGRSAEAVLADMGQAPPLRRIGTPAEFAAAVVFLASEPARYITGAVLNVDGGLTRSIV
jgi:3-oxoacyl-[acyl-carrier protein] reductase